MSNTFNRRNFLAASGAAMGAIMLNPLSTLSGKEPEKVPSNKKLRLAMVGTGHRGAGMFGEKVTKGYSDYVTFVGLCDPNPGRLEYAKKRMGIECPVYTDFDKMMTETKPDTLIVTTVDGFHHQYIVRGMELGANIISEKPMTIDEQKCQAIIDAEQRTGKKVTVSFNYRYSPHRRVIWEQLRKGAIGKITSVDFHWYLDTRHGADYFRRWHRRREFSGSLWLHKASHHFDLLNWWIDSDPVEVFAYANLDFYGKNGAFRAENCRTCAHTQECNFYMDISKSKYYMDLYVANEKYDGYLRDGCVFKEDIDIFDKMGAGIKYANGVQVSYSLTGYSPYEGYRIAFNGAEGRIDAWIQESNPTYLGEYDEIMISHNFGKREFIRVPQSEGHGGGDTLLLNSLFIPGTKDPYRQSAGARDGALSILVGTAARISCDTGNPIKIGALTSIKPQAQKM
ncbi:MAG: Gfo/Idh/MocA family oxidoreductase [Prevotellaceae bacterium]|jgi:predicted dehydrogenase|nr:Gfo/Idh/MocA family oxidoreductase [Prevotellaceae bacterium]